MPPGPCATWPRSARRPGTCATPARTWTGRWPSSRPTSWPATSSMCSGTAPGAAGPGPRPARSRTFAQAALAEPVKVAQGGGRPGAAGSAACAARDPGAPAPLPGGHRTDLRHQRLHWTAPVAAAGPSTPGCTGTTAGPPRRPPACSSRRGGPGALVVRRGAACWLRLARRAGAGASGDGRAHRLLLAGDLAARPTPGRSAAAPTSRPWRICGDQDEALLEGLALLDSLGARQTARGCTVSSGGAATCARPPRPDPEPRPPTGRPRSRAGRGARSCSPRA